jgi:hypothetical protein
MIHRMLAGSCTILVALVVGLASPASMSAQAADSSGKMISSTKSVYLNPQPLPPRQGPREGVGVETQAFRFGVEMPTDEHTTAGGKRPEPPITTTGTGTSSGGLPSYLGVTSLPPGVTIPSPDTTTSQQRKGKSP